MKFVHAADLHIDSPLRGLSAYEGAPAERVRGATRRAFSNLVQLCLDERAALLLLAGDVFDGEWRDFNTGLFFLRELNRLRDAGTRVFLVRGNHDAQSEVTRALKLPDHVHPFSHQAAETVVLEEEGVALHGLSFAQRQMPDSLVPRYPAPVAGLFNIGLLHTSAAGSPDHAVYAPCSVEELVQKRYDYWALGHVHARTVLHRHPWVVFPGNTQGRHIRETGPKGATVVTLEAGAVSQLRSVALDVVRWERLTLCPTQADSRDDLYDRAEALLARARDEAEGRLVAVRLAIEGPTRLHGELLAERERMINELRARSLELGDEVWLEKVELRTRPALDLEELRASEGFIGELLQELARARLDLDPLRSELQPLFDKLGDELAVSELDLAGLLDQAEARLLAALVAP